MVTLVTLMNITDTTGRFFGGNRKFFLPLKLLKLLSWIRWIQVAICIRFYYKDYGSDIIKLIHYVIFGLTHGYIQTVCCVISPGSVQVNQIESVGLLISVAISLGISIGGLIQMIFA